MWFKQQPETPIYESYSVKGRLAVISEIFCIFAAEIFCVIPPNQPVMGQSGGYAKMQNTYDITKQLLSFFFLNIPT